MKEGVKQLVTVFAAPEQFFSAHLDKIQNGNLLRNGVLTVLLAAGCGTAAFLLLGERAAVSNRLILIVFGALLALAGVISALIKAGLYHLFAGFRDRQGDVRTVLVSQLFSFAPFLLLLPAALILRAVGLEGVFFFIYLYLLFRSYRIELAGVRTAYRFTRGRGVLLVALPVALQAVFCVMAVVGVLVVSVGVLLAGSGLI